jgi:hypothetical protein
MVEVSKAVVVNPPHFSIGGDMPLVIGLNGLMIGLGAWLGAWAFKQIVRSWEQNFNRLEKDIEYLHSIQASLGDLYVRRDDFIRALAGFDNKLDSIANRQDEQFKMLLDRLNKG